MTQVPHSPGAVADLRRPRGDPGGSPWEARDVGDGGGPKEDHGGPYCGWTNSISHLRNPEVILIP